MANTKKTAEKKTATKKAETTKTKKTITYRHWNGESYEERTREE